MKAPFFVILAISFIIINSCTSPLIDLNEDHLLQTWVYENYLEDLEAHRYLSADKLSEDAPGIIIKPRGKLVVRQNIGWCGTPPITYKNYDGKWEYLSDSTIHISNEFWGTENGEPLLKQNYKILELNKNEMILKIQF